MEGITTIITIVVALAMVMVLFSWITTTIQTTPGYHDQTHQTYSFLIYQTGTDILAKNGTTQEIEYNSRIATETIQYAIDHLTTGRTWFEKVLIEGDFEIAPAIHMASYTYLDIDGRLIASGPDNIINITGCSNVEIANGILDANAGAFDDDPEADIENCIFVADADDISIHDMVIQNSLHFGIRLDGHLLYYPSNVERIQLRDNSIRDCKFGVHIQEATSVIVANNQIYSCGLAIGMASNSVDVTIADNQLIDSWLEHGIYAGESQRVTITGNLIARNNASGIQIRPTYEGSTCRDFIISDNIISDNLGNGMNIDGAETDSAMDRVSVSNNIIKNNWMGGVRLYDSDNITIQNNQFYDDLTPHKQIFSVGSVGTNNYISIQHNQIASYNGYSAIYHTYTVDEWGDHVKIANNYLTEGDDGDKTENFGTINMLKDTDEVIVAHGLIREPLRIWIQATSFDTNGSVVVDANNTYFTILNPETIVLGARVFYWWANIYGSYDT